LSHHAIRKEDFELPSHLILHASFRISGQLLTESCLKRHQGRTVLPQAISWVSLSGVGSTIKYEADKTFIAPHQVATIGNADFSKLAAGIG
jgi:hypothetical protein